MMHSQIIELIPTQTETTRLKGQNREAGLNTKIVNGKLSGSETETTKNTFATDNSIWRKYNRVEDELFSKDLIDYGVESFWYEVADVESIKAKLKVLDSDFGFKVPEQLISDFEKGKMNEWAIKNIQRISKIKGYVALQGLVSINYDAKESLLIINSPLNNSLISGTPVLYILINCDNSFLTSLGKEMFSKNDRVDMTCIGKVTNWNSVANNMSVCPIAIY